MCVIPQLIPKRTAFQIQSLASIAFSHELGIDATITQLADARGVARSTIYRQAEQLQQNLEKLPKLRRQNKELRTQNIALQQQLNALQNPLQSGLPFFCELTPEKVAFTTLELFVRGLSIESIRASLRILFAPLKLPSVGTIAAIVKQAALLAQQIIDNTPSLYPLDTVEFDELFHANKPIFAMLEPYSMALVLLESFDDAKADTWNFAIDYHDIELPGVMAHDCSAQGIALVERQQRRDFPTSQLCWWHRLRNLRRELDKKLLPVYKKALRRVDEKTWNLASQIEEDIGQLFDLSEPIQLEERRIRCEDDALGQLLEAIVQIQSKLDQLSESYGKKLKLSSLENLYSKAEHYVSYLSRIDWICEHILFGEESYETPMALLDAHAAVYSTQIAMKDAFEDGDNELYRKEQEEYLKDCERLRKIQSECLNSGFAKLEFSRMLGYKTRTSSRTEALNRRLRGFVSAKRQINSNLLALLQLHHNTTAFTKDSKRAGKSPWQRLDLDVSGLDEGFVGVLKAANDGGSWPSSWDIKA